MNAFFSTPERIEALNTEARSWVGTPFAPHAMVKGAGADCVHLVARIFLALGVIQKFEPPKYMLDEGAHGENSKAIDWLEGNPQFERIAQDPGKTVVGSRLQPGDIIVMNIAKVEHHIGLMLEHGDFVQAMYRRKVIISNLRESLFSKNITAIYRPVEVPA